MSRRPAGNHFVHGPAAAARPRAQAKKLRPGSYLAVELNSRSAVPEWGGQEVYVMEEDPAWLSDEGYVFFRPRQTGFYLVP